MSNVFEKIGHGVEVAAVDAAKVAVDVVVKGPEYLVKAAAVIATAIKDQPEIKQAVLGLIQNASVVVGDVATDVADKGVNLQADAKTLADAEAFFAYFKNTFIPLVEKVYTEVKADVASTN